MGKFWLRHHHVTDHFRKKSIVFRDTRDHQEHDSKNRLPIPGPSPEKSVAEIDQLKKNWPYWLLKSGRHRNIRVVQSDEILNDEKEKFIQKMISPPLLVNGRKFDIGTYVVLAQGEPLRVFLLDEWLIRFCNTGKQHKIPRKRTYTSYLL